MGFLLYFNLDFNIYDYETQKKIKQFILCFLKTFSETQIETTVIPLVWKGCLESKDTKMLDYYK